MENLKNFNLNLNEECLLVSDFFLEYKYKLIKFDKILIDYYMLIWLWEKKKYINKFNIYKSSIKNIENSFFKNFYLFDSLSYLKFFEISYYLFFYKFLIYIKLNLKNLGYNFILFINYKFINKDILLIIFSKYLNLQIYNFNIIEPINDSILNVIDDVDYIFFDNDYYIYLFDLLFETVRYKYNKYIDNKLEERKFEDFFMGWIHFFNYFFNNFLFLRIRRRHRLIKYLLLLNNDFFYLENIYILKRYSKLIILLTDFFLKKKSIPKLCYNYKFFNKKLKEEQEKKNIYKILIRFHLLPYLRFFLLNKFIISNIFSIFNLFSNIYFLCTIFLNIIKKRYKFFLIAIYDLSIIISLINYVNKFYDINVTRNISIILFIKRGFYNKYSKVKFLCNELFLFQEAIFFLLNLLFNIKFKEKNFKLIQLNYNIYDQFLTKLYKNLDINYVIKGNLSLNINYNLLLKRLNLIIFDKNFIKFLQINLIKFFNNNIILEKNKKLYFLLYNFYYMFFDFFINYNNIISDLNILPTFENIYLFNILNLQEFDNFYYFRFYNNFYFFFKNIINFKKLSYNILKVLNFYFFKKLYSLRCINLNLEGILINGFFFKRLNLTIKKSIPIYFFFNLLSKLNIIFFNKVFLKISYNINLLFLNVEDIYFYYYHIYFIIYLYYYKFFDSIELKKIYYILRKSCFLTLNLKLKKFNNYLTLKKFNKKFFFNFSFLDLKLKKKFLNNYFEIWFAIFYFNYLDITFLLTKNLIKNTTRKEDILYEKSFEIARLKIFLKLWHIYFFFNLNLNNFIFFKNDLFFFIFKKLKISGGHINIDSNYFVIENPYFEFYYNIDRFFLNYVNFEYLQDYYFDLSNLIKNIKNIENLKNLLYNSMLYLNNLDWFYNIYDIYNFLEYKKKEDYNILDLTSDFNIENDFDNDNEYI